MIKLESHLGVTVLRDDLLSGGTKSVILPKIVKKGVEQVYASPVYGGFQIALSIYGKKHKTPVTIFCAKRGVMHSNTLECKKNGAKIIEVECGYLSVIESRAKNYATLRRANKIAFGAHTAQGIELISERVNQVIKKLGKEPKEIFCAVGSGTLVEAILKATKKALVKGVVVGKECTLTHERLTLLQYHKPFEKPATMEAPFPSMRNYDAKAFEYCIRYKNTDSVLFWNVL